MTLTFARNPVPFQNQTRVHQVTIPSVHYSTRGIQSRLCVDYAWVGHLCTFLTYETERRRKRRKRLKLWIYLKKNRNRLCEMIPISRVVLEKPIYLCVSFVKEDT